MESKHSSQPSLNIALLPPPTFLGHLIPFIELAKKLVSHHNCSITLIIVDGDTSVDTQKSLLQNLPTSITPIFLPPPPSADLQEHEHDPPEVIVTTRMIRSLPALRHTLSSLGTPPAALVVDLFGAHAVDVAKELGIPTYIFYVIAAYHLLSFMDYLKFDDQSSPPENPPQFTLPGNQSAVVEEADFTDFILENKIKFHRWFTDLCKNYPLANGILVNSYLELETAAFQELELRHRTGPAIFGVGPLIRRGSGTESYDRHYCLKWLDDQPPNSVLYVSFGSGGSLSVEQIEELAMGLEISGQRFLWVVRSPQENAVTAYLNLAGEVDPILFLPEGFLERTKGRGLVVGTWAPQTRVLSHSSIGGFVTHCGWNSILEGAFFGVPLIAWPLCFEQRTTATYIAEGLKGAIRVRENENGIVERMNISRVVKQLMEGEEGDRIRDRMTQFKSAAASVMSEEGSSTKALAQVVQNWLNGK